MNLDLFNNLSKNVKENEEIRTFTKELGEFLEKNSPKNNERNQTSLLQKIQDEKRVTVSYIDKMNIERSNILNNYAKETSENGVMYYIYSKSSKEDMYNLCICEEEKRHEIIQVKENDLPNGAGVDSVLRIKNEKYILDIDATENILKQMQKMIDELLEEQLQMLNQNRMEGHSYEIIEVSGDRVWLKDTSSNSAKTFEEIDFSKEDLVNATEGAIFKYMNGKYHYISEN